MLGVFLVGLEALEFAWLTWCLAEPLPNASNVGGKVKVRRWIFFAQAFPEVVPGVAFSESYFGTALSELKHVENLPQRVPVLLGGCLIAGAGLGLGLSVLRLLGLHHTLDLKERVPLSIGLGATLLGVITLISGRLGLLNPWLCRLGLSLLVVTGFWGLKRDEWKWRWPKGSALQCFLLLLLGPLLAVMALRAMMPTIDFDALKYHLEGQRNTIKPAGSPSCLITSIPRCPLASRCSTCWGWR